MNLALVVTLVGRIERYDELLVRADSGSVLEMLGINVLADGFGTPDIALSGH